MSNAYEEDLAYIHDQGFGHFARNSATGLLKILQRAGIEDGLVVDLGCGSGIWAQELSRAGYDVMGVDLSSAMIAMCRERVPQGKFRVGSFLEIPLSKCRAVTALGEVLNYRFDERNNAAALKKLLKKIYAALEPGGVLIFDLAEPGRRSEDVQRCWEGADWDLQRTHEHDPKRQRLTRKIVSFRKVGEHYRRHAETHSLQLYKSPHIAQLLRDIGFTVQTTRGYGEYRFPKFLAGFVARKPA